MDKNGKLAERYDDLASRYSEINRRNSVKFLAGTIFRPKVNGIMRLARRGKQRCMDNAKIAKVDRQDNTIGDFLKEVYLGNFTDELYDLQLTEIITIRKNCEYLADKIKTRTLDRDEYKTIYSIARAANGWGNEESFKKLARLDFSNGAK